MYNAYFYHRMYLLKDIFLSLMFSQCTISSFYVLVTLGRKMKKCATKYTQIRLKKKSLCFFNKHLASNRQLFSILAFIQKIKCLMVLFKCLNELYVKNELSFFKMLTMIRENLELQYYQRSFICIYIYSIMFLKKNYFTS